MYCIFMHFVQIEECVKFSIVNSLKEGAWFLRFHLQNEFLSFSSVLSPSSLSVVCCLVDSEKTRELRTPQIRNAEWGQGHFQVQHHCNQSTSMNTGLWERHTQVGYTGTYCTFATSSSSSGVASFSSKLSRTHEIPRSTSWREREKNKEERHQTYQPTRQP